jgi:hypothetical protein
VSQAPERPTRSRITFAACSAVGTSMTFAWGWMRQRWARPFAQAGDPEVEDLHVSVASEKEILGLEIAVHDSRTPCTSPVLPLR